MTVRETWFLVGGAAATLLWLVVVVLWARSIGRALGADRRGLGDREP